MIHVWSDCVRHEVLVLLRSEFSFAGDARLQHVNALAALRTQHEKALNELRIAHKVEIQTEQDAVEKLIRAREHQHADNVSKMQEVWF